MNLTQFQFAECNTLMTLSCMRSQLITVIF